MSIADVELGLPTAPPMPFPEAMVRRHGVLMTRQNRIRFEIALMVGHVGMMIDYSCYPQADFELERDGPRTINAFLRSIDNALASAHVEAENGGPIAEEIRRKIGSYLFSLDDGESHDVHFREGSVSLSGRTVCKAWRDPS